MFANDLIVCLHVICDRLYRRSILCFLLAKEKRRVVGCVINKGPKPAAKKTADKKKPVAKQENG